MTFVKQLFLTTRRHETHHYWRRNAYDPETADQSREYRAKGELRSKKVMQNSFKNEGHVDNFFDIVA